MNILANRMLVSYRINYIVTTKYYGIRTLKGDPIHRGNIHIKVSCTIFTMIEIITPLHVAQPIFGISSSKLFLVVSAIKAFVTRCSTIPANGSKRVGSFRQTNLSLGLSSKPFITHFTGLSANLAEISNWSIKMSAGSLKDFCGQQWSPTINHFIFSLSRHPQIILTLHILFGSSQAYIARQYKYRRDPTQHLAFSETVTMSAVI